MLIREDEAPAGVPRRILDSWRVAGILSLAAHAAIAFVSIFTVAQGLSSGAPAPAATGQSYPLPDPEAPIVVELPSAEGTADLVAAPSPTGESKVAPPPKETASGAKTAHVDDGTSGKGGDATVAQKARNLAPHAEDSTTTDATRDAIADEQENRLLTAKQRKSRIDLRVALEPMELTFVASGKGYIYERHPVAKTNAALGVTVGDGTKMGGAALGQGLPAEGASDVAKLVGTNALGGDKVSPAKGAAYGQPVVGSMQIVGANVAKARPHVDKGKKPSVASNTKGSPADTADSDQAVANAMASLVSMSTKGGDTLGDGQGGSGGGGVAAAGGGAGEGSKAVALGDGNGSADATHATLRTTYFLGLQKRLGPLMKGTFPKEQELDLHNGTVIVDLVIGKSGNLLDVIVVRPSGFQEFDQNVVTRIRGAGLFEPVPELLSTGPSITIRVPVFGGWRLP